MLTLQPNFAKEPFSPSRSNAKTTDPDKTKNSTFNVGKCLVMSKAQYTTINISQPEIVGIQKLLHLLKLVTV